LEKVVGRRLLSSIQLFLHQSVGCCVISLFALAQAPLNVTLGVPMDTESLTQTRMDDNERYRKGQVKKLLNYTVLGSAWFLSMGLVNIGNGLCQNQQACGGTSAILAMGGLICFGTWFFSGCETA
jgi:hypothetical protein